MVTIALFTLDFAQYVRDTYGSSSPFGFLYRKPCDKFPSYSCRTFGDFIDETFSWIMKYFNSSIAL